MYLEYRLIRGLSSKEGFSGQESPRIRHGRFTARPGKNFVELLQGVLSQFDSVARSVDSN